MSEVATLPPIMMGQFEVIPTRRGWRLMEWRYDASGRYASVHRRFMDRPLLRSMSP